MSKNTSEFNYKGKKIILTRVEGTVVDADEKNTSNTHSARNPGALNSHITTTHTQNQRFFIKPNETARKESELEEDYLMPITVINKNLMLGRDIK